MVDEEYLDDAFDQEPDDSMEVGSDDFRRIVLYREIDGMGTPAPFRQKVCDLDNLNIQNFSLEDVGGLNVT